MGIKRVSQSAEISRNCRPIRRLGCYGRGFAPSMTGTVSSSFFARIMFLVISAYFWK
jgi:hypothetical protein